MESSDYKPIKITTKEAKANKRGLKAANKIKSGSKSVAHDKERNNYEYCIKNYIRSITR